MAAQDPTNTALGAIRVRSAPIDLLVTQTPGRSLRVQYFIPPGEEAVVVAPSYNMEAFVNVPPGVRVQATTFLRVMAPTQLQSLQEARLISDPPDGGRVMLKCPKCAKRRSG